MERRKRESYGRKNEKRKLKIEERGRMTERERYKRTNQEISYKAERKLGAEE